MACVLGGVERSKLGRKTVDGGGASKGGGEAARRGIIGVAQA